MQRLQDYLKKSLRNQTIFYLMLLFILLSLLVVGVTRQYATNYFYALTEENYQSRLLIERDALDNFLLEKKRHMELFLRQNQWNLESRYPKGGLSENWYLGRVQDGLIFFKDNNLRDFEQVFMITPGLEMYSYSNLFTAELPLRAAAEQYERVAGMPGINFQDPRISRRTGEPIIIVTGRLQHYNETIAAFGATLYVRSINQVVLEKSKPMAGLTYVLFEDTYLFHPDSRLILEKSNTQTEDLPAREGIFSLPGEKGQGELRVFSAASQVMPEVRVVSEIPAKVLYAEVNNYLTILYTIFFLGLLVVLAISYRVTRKLMEPIFHLQETMEQAIAGDFLARVQNPKEDELGQAMTSFNILMERITRLTFFDKLTSLPNYLQFSYWFDREQSNLKPEGSEGMILLSVHGFKKVNESFGMEAGDQVIVEMADRLRSWQKRNPGITYLTRLAGDEFILIYDQVDTIQELEEEVRNLLSALALPYLYKHQSINIRFVVGGVLWKRGARDLPTLISIVTNARSMAKKEERACLILNDSDDILEILNQRKQLENDLQRALTDKRFQVLYQPVYSVKEDRIIGLEALLRYWHPDRGMVSPREFIPVAEEIGIIDKIGRMVLAESGSQLERLEEAGYPNLEMHVNISPLHFNQEHFAEEMIQLAKSLGIPSRKIWLEITEEIALFDLEGQARKIRKLQEAGFRISIDDFGTGYASFLYLNQLSVDQIKIDKSFVLNMRKNQKDYEIIKTIVTLAKSLEMDLVAEGVETRECMEALMEMGVEKIQGYYLARPQPPEELPALLERKL